MGLLDTLKKGLLTGAEMYGSASQPAPPEVVKGLLGFTPGVGDAISAYDAYDAAKQGNWGEAALNGAGVLPFVPSLAGMIKTPVGRIAENASDTRLLSDMLQRAGESAGYVVRKDGSSISPSIYVTFEKNGDEAGDTVRQVRISNHADKHPDKKDGIRTSSDPETGISFEQSVNWLAREGFPTKLSTRYKDIPDWGQYYARQAENAKADLIARQNERLNFLNSFTPTYKDYLIRDIVTGGKNNRAKAYEIISKGGGSARIPKSTIDAAIKTNPDRSVLYEHLISLLQK